MTERPPRNLSDTERKVWRRVTKTVTPKPQKGVPKPMPTREEFGQMMRVRQDAPSAARERRGELELRNDKAVRRGRVKIDARLDLHDLTLSQGWPALERGLIRSYNRGQSCVLVITGKGMRLEGKLRQALPGWLADPALRPIVATYSQAHIRHGGTGAWYVFLKAAR